MSTTALESVEFLESPCQTTAFHCNHMASPLGHLPAYFTPAVPAQTWSYSNSRWVIIHLLEIIIKNPF